MKKIIPLITVLSACGVSYANDFVIDTEQCAGTEFIRDQDNVLVEYDPAIHTFVDESTPVFYAGEQLLPLLWVNTNRLQHISVTNTSDSNVGFFFKPVFYSDNQGGQASTAPNTLVLGASFSQSNNPLSGEGSSMQPRSSGRITYDFAGSLFSGQAAMAWDSSVCFDSPPMLTSVEYLYRSGTRGSTDVEHINNGQPW